MIKTENLSIGGVGGAGGYFCHCQGKVISRNPQPQTTEATK